jgi:hypothetical protein
MTSTEEKYLECSCIHCGGGIAFPEQGVGMTVACPHCSQDTVLSFEKEAEVPQPQSSDSFSNFVDSDDGVDEMSKPLDFSWPQRRSSLNSANGKLPRPGQRYSSFHMAKPVNFYFAAPKAEVVSLVGEFNHWNPEAHPMKRRDDGTWHLQLALNHGHHQYAYLVDGKRFLDPAAGGIGRNEKNERVSLIAVS